MTESAPLFVAVAPNGARYGRTDHQSIPITPAELTQTAVECLEAGATMFHLHVRDKLEQHSLSPKDYKPAVEMVKAAVGDDMIIQVTSEAAGRYSADEQMSLMLELMPEYLSIALREFLPAGGVSKQFRNFIQQLSLEKTVVQYILYDEKDYRLYLQLLSTGVIPDSCHSLLFVLGRYSKTSPTAEIVDEYKEMLSTSAPCMVCTFGMYSYDILSRVVPLGCHIRLGFENGFYLPDGKVAKTNAEIIKTNIQLFKQSGKTIADIAKTRTLLEQSQKR